MSLYHCISCLPAKSSQIRRNIDSGKIAVANAPRNPAGITGYTDNAPRGSDLIGKQRNRRCALRAHENHVRIDYANTSPDANVYLGSGASSRYTAL